MINFVRLCVDENFWQWYFMSLSNSSSFSVDFWWPSFIFLWSAVKFSCWCWCWCRCCRSSCHMKVIFCRNLYFLKIFIVVSFWSVSVIAGLLLTPSYCSVIIFLSFWSFFLSRWGFFFNIFCYYHIRWNRTKMSDLFLLSLGLLWFIFQLLKLLRTRFYFDFIWYHWAYFCFRCNSWCNN